METSISATITAWARARNQRTLIGVLARAGGAWLVIGLVAASLLKLPDLFKRVGIKWPKLLPGPHLLPTLVTWVAGILVVAVAVASLSRYLRRRTRPQVLARSLDAKHATSDLLVTAIAVEAEEKTRPAMRKFAEPGLSSAVLGRARSFTGSIKPPVRNYRPALGYALLSIFLLSSLFGGIVFMPATVLPRGLFGDRHRGEAEAAEEEQTAPKLTKQERDKLKQMEDQLQELEKQQGLRESSKRKLAQARKELGLAAKNSGRSAGHLSAAEQALRELAQDVRDQGGLFDPPALEPQPLDTITKQLADAIDRGDADTAGAMADELARRAKTQSDSGLKQMADSLNKALAGSPSATNKNVDPKDRNHWRDLAGKAGQHWDKAEPSAAKSKLRELVEDMNSKGARSLDQALSGLSDIRSNQLQALNRERGNGDPGQANGQQGAGDKSGNPGDKSDSGGKPGDKGNGKPGDKGAGDKGNGSGNGKDPSKDPGNKSGAGSGNASNGTGKDKSGSGNGSGNDPSKGSTTDNTGDGSGGVDQGGGPSNKQGDPRDPFTRRVPSEQVRVARRGPLPGAVGAISRHMQGAEDSGDYGQVHRKYESIAEGTMRSEAIPLTRRDYIRHYFEAVRPQ